MTESAEPLRAIDSTEASEAAAAEARRVNLPRWLVRVSIAVAAISLVSTWVGAFLAPEFVNNNPRLLILLNPRNTNLVLVSNEISDFWFFTIGFLRLVFSDPFNYLIGLYFGERALAWAERRSRTYGSSVRDGERLFRRFGYFLVFFAPNNIICILSGATGMKARWFFPLNFAGTITRLVLINQFGNVFEGPIDSILDFVKEYRTPLLVLSGLGVAWTIFGEFRGDNSELKGLRELEHEISDETQSGSGQPAQGSDPRRTELERTEPKRTELKRTELKRTDPRPGDPGPTEPGLGEPR